MTVKVGDRVPSATLRYVTPDGVQAVSTDDFFRGKKVALFAVPGAFTRTCSQRHLPSYVTNAAELKAKGVDTIACIAVNDQFVMNAWGKEHGAGDNIVMLGDGSGDFTRAMDSSSTASKRVWERARSAIRCWSTTASSRRSMSSSRACSTFPAPRPMLKAL